MILSHIGHTSRILIKHGVYIVKRSTTGWILNNRRAVEGEEVQIRILSVSPLSELYLLANHCILEPVKFQSL